jgi:hypothetical protein
MATFLEISSFRFFARLMKQAEAFAVENRYLKPGQQLICDKPFRDTDKVIVAWINAA